MNPKCIFLLYDSVWDNASTETKQKLEAVHIEAARTIAGATKLCSLQKLFDDLGWESLQSRRYKHKLIILYKIMHGLAPDYLRDVLPPSVHETTSYNLRNANHIQTLSSNTNLFYNSFFPSTIRARNSLLDDNKQAPSVAFFKYQLNKNMKRPPKYYNVGLRIGQILHTRLRLECSSLNSHLYQENFVPSPSCLCCDFESSYHFLFICPRYTVARNLYLPNDLPSFTTHDLLFGKVNEPSNVNERFFLQVQEFIIKSGRFINNEHSGGCRRQPSTPAEGGRRAKLVCMYRIYHFSEAIKLKTRRPPAGFLVLQSHHSHSCKLWGTSAFSPLGFNGWFTFQFFHAVFCTQ